MAIKVPGPDKPQAGTLLGNATSVSSEWYSIPKAPAPNWRKWANMPSVELWEAVALSLNIEPTYNPQGTCPDFDSRMAVALAHLHPNGELQVIKRDPRAHRSRVQLADVARLAASLNMVWELPGEFPRAEKAPQVVTAQEPESPPLVSDEYVPKPNLFALPGVKTTDIMEAFGLVGKKWLDIRKNDKRYWKAIHTPGGRGKGMHIWKPADFAICLLNSGERNNPGALRAIITGRWPDWLPEFEFQLEEVGKK